MNVHDPELQASLIARQKEAWQRGKRSSIESIVRESGVEPPEEVLQALIYNEITARRAKGESPTLDDYAYRFPGIGLARLFSLAAAPELDIQPDTVAAQIAPEEHADTPPPQDNVSVKPSCALCGGSLEHGFLWDTGDGNSSCWVQADPHETVASLGGVKHFIGRTSRVVHSLRCGRCGHLHLFAIEERPTVTPAKAAAAGAVVLAPFFIFLAVLFLLCGLPMLISSLSKIIAPK